MARQVFILATCLIGLPLLGAALAGHDVSHYLQFPPRTQSVEHAPFSWTVFVLIGAVELLTLVAIGAGISLGQREKPMAAQNHGFPLWGWAAAMLNGSFWLVSWGNFEWLRPWQLLFFSGLWLSYILLANALTCWRTGFCYVTHRRCELLVLFPSSAVFWWYFEYLNRFVQNWHYLGVDKLSAASYVLSSTLAFSTVLPAVFSTLQLLKTFQKMKRLGFYFSSNVQFSIPHAWMVLVMSALGLAAIQIWPDFTFPLVWSVPFFLVFSVLAINRQEGILSVLRQDRGNTAILSMLSALLCGFFWELWNYHSEPKWVYSIPFVDAFPIFEMPVLGYFGYLPFGLECLLVGEAVKIIGCHRK